MFFLRTLSFSFVHLSIFASASDPFFLVLLCSSLFKFPPPSPPPPSPSPPSPPPPSPPPVIPDPTSAPAPIIDLALERDDAHLSASVDFTDHAETLLTSAAITEQQPTLNPFDALPVLPPPSAPRPSKRAVERDEFGLSSAQRRLQLQAMAKLQHSPQEHLTVTNAEPSLPVARKRAALVDDFGLTAAKRKLQLKALEKLQFKAPVVSSKLSANDSSARNGLNNDHCDFSIDSDATQCPDSQATARLSRSGSVNALLTLDPHSSEKLDAKTGGSDAARKVIKRIEKTVKQGASSSDCPSPASATITTGVKKRRGSKEGSSHQCTVVDDVLGVSCGSHRNVKKSKSKNMYWPSTPQMGALCQAGCENQADAHFSCSHNFCSDCLCGIRRHQKKKKSEAQRL
jgi:hypothetical protein